METCQFPVSIVWNEFGEAGCVFDRSSYFLETERATSGCPLEILVGDSLQENSYNTCLCVCANIAVMKTSVPNIKCHWHRQSISEHEIH